MKDRKQIKSELDTYKEELRLNHGYKDRKMKREICMREESLLYLETNPREPFVVEMRNHVKRVIKILNKRYPAWAETNGDKFKNPRTIYNREMGIPSLRQKLKTLNYLLSED